MSKELDKFKARRKAMQGDIDTYSIANADKEAAKMRTLKLDGSSNGEDYLQESMVKARKNGVTGDALADFMRDKDFQEGVKVLTLSCKNMEKGFAAGKAWAERAATAHAALQTLAKDMDKDLKGRKDKSESKKEIQDLRATLDKEITRLGKAAAVYSTMHPTLLDYPNKLADHILRILKQAPDAQERVSDINLLPQMLVDRNRKAAVSKAMARLKDINDACARAIDLAGTDLKAAQPELKAAGAALVALKAVNDEFQKAYKHVGDSLKGTKDEKAVDEAAEKIAKAYALGESKLRGTATTIKKAA